MIPVQENHNLRARQLLFPPVKLNEVALFYPVFLTKTTGYLHYVLGILRINRVGKGIRMNLNKLFVLVCKDNIELNSRIFHPERLWSCLFKDKQHTR